MLPTERAHPRPVVSRPPAEPALGLVLTCASTACRHSFEPDPITFAAARLACPRCGGWSFAAELVEPTTAGGA